MLYLTFVALIVMMVFKSCGQNIELETKDYYNEELKYQSKIDALKLGEVYKDSIQILASKDFVVLQIPSKLQADSLVLDFVKPDDAKSDRHFVLKSLDQLSFKKSEFKSGVYKLSVNMYHQGVYRLVEKQIMIQ